eukprot:scaffold4511_cov171-Amphora_coffeaeformis.AAC.21
MHFGLHRSRNPWDPLSQVETRGVNRHPCCHYPRSSATQRIIADFSFSEDSSTWRLYATQYAAGQIRHHDTDLARKESRSSVALILGPYRPYPLRERNLSA